MLFYKAMEYAHLSPTLALSLYRGKSIPTVMFIPVKSERTSNLLQNQG